MVWERRCSPCSRGNGHDCEPRTCAWIDEQRNDDVLDVMCSVLEISVSGFGRGNMAVRRIARG